MTTDEYEFFDGGGELIGKGEFDSDHAAKSRAMDFSREFGAEITIYRKVGVVDETDATASEQRNEAETSIRKACNRNYHDYIEIFQGANYCPGCGERLRS